MAVKVFLGLGSNEGDRRENLQSAATMIRERSCPGNFRVSPIYETPALLPEGARAEWNRPFLNLVVEAILEGTPDDALVMLKQLEIKLGRGAHARWAPRTIDIDLLLWGDKKIDSADLVVPHPHMMERAFVLDPLKDLNASYVRVARAHPQHSPLWMAVLNITPDSFSDGGQWNELSSISHRLDEWDAMGVPILDIGAESTRPGATPVSPREEWSRLEPVLRLLRDRYAHSLLKPLISVDTRYCETAAQAIELGVDIINDVGGLSEPAMLDVLKHSQVQYVLMHSLSIPADPTRTLTTERDPMPEIIKWFEEKLMLLSEAGVSPDRVLLDPGVGFGKTALQSLEILRNIDRLLALPYRVMVGHSRKSFLSTFGVSKQADRDLETIGASLQLAGQGVDVIRVHDPVSHIRAARAWNHLNKSAP